METERGRLESDLQYKKKKKDGTASRVHGKLNLKWWLLSESSFDKNINSSTYKTKKREYCEINRLDYTAIIKQDLQLFK